MVEVNSSKRKDEDPLDKLVKLTSIGTSIAGMASKAGGVAKAKDPNSHLNTGIQADNPVGDDAMSRRMNKLKTSYA